MFKRANFAVITTDGNIVLRTKLFNLLKDKEGEKTVKIGKMKDILDTGYINDVKYRVEVVVWNDYAYDSHWALRAVIDRVRIDYNENKLSTEERNALEKFKYKLRLDVLKEFETGTPQTYSHETHFGIDFEAPYGFLHTKNMDEAIKLTLADMIRKAKFVA